MLAPPIAGPICSPHKNTCYHVACCRFQQMSYACYRHAPGQVFMRAESCLLPRADCMFYFNMMKHSSSPQARSAPCYYAEGPAQQPPAAPHAPLKKGTESNRWHAAMLPSALATLFSLHYNRLVTAALYWYYASATYATSCGIEYVSPWLYHILSCHIIRLQFAATIITPFEHNILRY